MYYKCGVVFLCLNFLLGIWIVSLEEWTKGQDEKKIFAQMVSENANVVCLSETRPLVESASGQRIITYLVMDRIDNLPMDEYEVLLQIVEAEAGCEDLEGKEMVANVVLNRVKNREFPDTIRDVVYQREDGITQFSPVSNGTIHSVTISKETYDAVNRAVNGEDLTNGALYFAARDAADPEKMKWFDSHLTYLFVHGGHEFFR